MSETIVLDPSAVATGRTQLDITSWVLATNTGVDWGDAAMTAYTAAQNVGETRLHYRLPNRVITIPLALRGLGGTTYDTIRSVIQAKVGLLQAQGGWIMRQVGSTALYADVQSATLHLGGSAHAAFRSFDIDATLTLECLPDWYGDEVTLSDHVETILPHLFFTETTVNGNYPSRVRIVVDNDGTVDEHGLLWGLRSRYYDAGTTAALFYEAEQLLPVNGAAGTALAGASGGTAVVLTNPPTNTFVSMLSMSMVSGTTALTHSGSYRMWARCYSGSATPTFQLLWGIGSLSTPVTNDPVQLPGAGAFYLLDLGEVRFDAPPVGPNQWFGAIQSYSTVASQNAAVDCVWLQPLDDGAGKLIYESVAPASVIAGANNAGTAADSAAVGTVAWTNPINAATGGFASASLTITQASHYLMATNFGFALPSSATIVGVVASINKTCASPGVMLDYSVRLVKASAVVGTDHLQTGVNWPTTGSGPTTYGSSSDLWGTTLTFSDVNNSGFGIAIAATAGAGGIPAHINYPVTLTVYYRLSSGFTVVQDAVMAAGKTVELRTEGMFRQGGGGTVYGPVSQVIGDLPRFPPSGLETRSVQVFLKPTRGNFDTEADAGIDDLSARVFYRPSYLFTP